MANYLGDFALGATFDTKFCTVQSTGAPTTLAGTPVISAYVDNSTTQLTAGITLSVDFDSMTGLNNVRVVATTANGYLAGSNYQLVITTGTVNSVSVVSYVVGEFSIQARPPQIAATGATQGVGVADAGTLQSATGTTAVIRSGASATDATYVGHTLFIASGTGAGQSRLITAYTGASKTCTVDTWTTNPDNTSLYVMVATPPSSATSPVTATLGAAGSVALTEGYAPKGAAGTLPQLLYSVLQALTEFSTSSTTVTIKKRDQSTTAFTETLDSSSAPTSITQAT